GRGGRGAGLHARRGAPARRPVQRRRVIGSCVQGLGRGGLAAARCAAVGGGLERGIRGRVPVGLGQFRRLLGRFAHRLVCRRERGERGLDQRDGAFRAGRRVLGQLVDGFGKLAVLFGQLRFAQAREFGLHARYDVINVLAVGDRLLGA